MNTLHAPQIDVSALAPISVQEYEQRQETLRRLMHQHGIDALLLEAGASLVYFTGVQWGCSERLTAAIISVSGPLVFVCPHFEEPSFRKQMLPGADVRTWHEHENPYQSVAQVLAEWGVTSGVLGFEQQVRFFIYDEIKKVLPACECVSADPVTVPCRALKSRAELDRMQLAMDITVAAYKHVIPQLREGITRQECLSMAAAAHRDMGVSGYIDFQFGQATSFPHGGPATQVLKEGDLVLMDGGCTVQGYHSDISRPIVFGTPNQQHRQIWEVEKEAQAAAFSAAQCGQPCEGVDRAARQVIVDAGLGPDYALPGCPHRTGHGIGLDIHEAENMVRGNLTPLAPGMCFTIEPMIVTHEFGIRLEDCVYMTPDGPRWFTDPSPSIEQAFAS